MKKTFICIFSAFLMLLSSCSAHRISIQIDQQGGGSLLPPWTLPDKPQESESVDLSGLLAAPDMTGSLIGDCTVTDEGFVLMLNSEGTYNLISLGSYSGKNPVIPSYHNGIPITFISPYAFARHKDITNITLPEELTSISRDTFAACENLHMNAAFDCLYLGSESSEYKYLISCIDNHEPSLSIQEGCTFIADQAFESSELSTVYIPSTMKYIGIRAFRNCDKLENVYFDDNCRLEVIGENAFRKNPLLAQIDLPDTVTNIDAYAFAETGITSVKLPESLVRLGAEAFQGCKKLEEVIFGEKLEAIGSFSFAGCSELVQIDLPRGLKSLEYGAFLYCEKLKKVNIYDNLEYIDRYCVDEALYNGDEHGNFYIGNDENPYLYFLACNSVSLGASALSLQTDTCLIAYNAFEIYSHNVSAVNIKNPEKAKYLTVIDGCVIKKSNKTLIFGTYNCTIPADGSVVAIRDRAFEGNRKLATISIPSSVKVIGDSAFSGCELLMSLKLNEGLESIGDYAFSGCSQLRALTLPKTVRSVGDSAFNQAGLEKVDLGALKVLGNNAFASTRIRELTIPQTVSVIPAACFYQCTNLGDLKMSSVIEIENNAFSKCVSLDFIEFSEDLKIIGEYAFGECVSLLSLELPEGVTVIGEEAFSGCNLLSSVKLPESARYLGDGAFDGCIALSAIDLPENIQYFGEGVFRSCHSLQSLVMPAVKTDLTIADLEFCSSLKMLVLENTLTHIGPDSLSTLTALENVIFRGTTGEWREIERVSGWASESKGFTVICINGSILYGEGGYEMPESVPN